MNISFTIPNVDKCAKCVMHELHHKQYICICDICYDICHEFKKHEKMPDLRDKNRDMIKNCNNRIE
jgi:hypothetical protein